MSDDRKLPRASDGGAILGRAGGAGPGRVVPRGYREATLLFAEVANLSDLGSPQEDPHLAAMLEEIFAAGDAAAARHGLTRIGSPGCSWAAVGGAPDPRPHHLKSAVEVALALSDVAAGMVSGLGLGPALRIGIHTGPVVVTLGTAGRGVHEVWGEAARMGKLLEATGAPGHIHLSPAAAGQLEGRFRMVRRERARGMPEAYLLRGRLTA